MTSQPWATRLPFIRNPVPANLVPPVAEELLRRLIPTGAAISSQPDTPACPADVRVDPPEDSLSVPSVVLLNQIRTIDRRRLVKRLGRLRPDTMKLVNRALQISLGLAGV